MALGGSSEILMVKEKSRSLSLFFHSLMSGNQEGKFSSSAPALCLSASHRDSHGLSV